MNNPAPSVLLPVFGDIDCLNILIICLTTFDSSEFLGAKSKSKAKDTSFKKSGVAGVLKSPEAKKFRDTFRKKGLLPALRGK